MKATVTTLAGMNFVYKQTGKAGEAGSTIIELIVAPQDGAPPHRHAGIDELFYALDGTFDLTVGGKAERLQPGSFVEIPGGAGAGSVQGQSRHNSRVLGPLGIYSVLPLSLTLGAGLVVTSSREEVLSKSSL